MDRAAFKTWILEIKQQEYGEYPVEIQDFIREKWEGHFNKDEEAFPY
jgi:hypothetical protein